MHGERGERGLRGAPAQMNFPPMLISLGTDTHTHTPHFLAPLKSFNVSFTCFSQIPLSSSSEAAFEGKCDQNRGGGGVFKKKKKKPGLRAFGV